MTTFRYTPSGPKLEIEVSWDDEAVGTGQTE